MITLLKTILKSDYFLLLVWTLTLLFINILLALCFGVSHIRHIQSDTCAWQLFTCCLQDFSAITYFLFCYMWWIFKPLILFSWWVRCPWYIIWCCVFFTLFVILFRSVLLLSPAHKSAIWYLKLDSQTMSLWSVWIEILWISK
jgi:hypothetical protein